MNGLTGTTPKLPFWYEPPIALGAGAIVCPGVRICAHSYVNGGRIESGVYIGRYCSIGYSVTIGTGHHDMSLLSTSSWFDSDAKSTVKYAEPVVRVRIHHDVWVGDHSIILNGVTVGTGAVIAAGAVVTKDVPNYAIVVGSPARVLKYRFEYPIIRRLMNTQWWEFDDEIIKRHRLTPDIEASLTFLEELPPTARKKFTIVRLGASAV